MHLFLEDAQVEVQAHLVSLVFETWPKYKSIFLIRVTILGGQYTGRHNLPVEICQPVEIYTLTWLCGHKNVSFALRFKNK